MRGRRWGRALAYGVTFVAGGLAWEVIRLGSMNWADRRDLVDQMIDAQRRAHPIDYPAIRISSAQTPRDLLRRKAFAEYERCGGRLLPEMVFALVGPMTAADDIIALHDRSQEDQHRHEMAYSNSVFTLRRVQICRSFGGCGPKLPASIERASPSTLASEKVDEEAYSLPTTWVNAEPFVLSLACGMGVRESKGLPSYANEARLVSAYKAWQAGRTRRCAAGDRTACP